MILPNVTLPSMLVVLATIVFMVLERVFPGRELRKAKGWYGRALPTIAGG